MPDVIDLFAGPGGWDQALLGLAPDLDVLGVEIDKDACATGLAAGHKRLQTDVAQLDPLDFAPVAGLIASPPCQAYSSAGKQMGKLDRPLIDAYIKAIRERRKWVPYSLVSLAWHDPRSPLVLEPLRWALKLKPEWVCLEQVPAVLPLWEAVASILQLAGYSTATGLISAETLGVPQTRKRAILAASRTCEAALPTSTHRAYRKGVAQHDGDPNLLPWVSMAEALGWSSPLALRSSALANATVRDLDEPAPTITAGHDRAERVWMARNSGPGAARDPRASEEPSYTIRANGSGSHPAGVEWVSMAGSGAACKIMEPRPTETPAQTLTGKGTAEWIGNRPVTTICGDARITPPGHRDWSADGVSQFDKSTMRVNVQEAAVLQTFPADYPWQGSKTAQYQQIGNAIPPLMARAILAQVVGVDAT